MFALLGSLFLGWSLGANDAANVFGTAVSARMIRFWTAAVLCAIFVVLGALLEGRAGIETLGGLTQLSLQDAVISSFAAAITVGAMTLIKFPVSTSQAVVGTILGIGLIDSSINFNGLGKVIACWIGTPIGGFLFAILFYKLLSLLFTHLKLTIFQLDQVLRIALIITGCYGAYALGANNVANITAVFVSAGMLTIFQATLIGGLSIAIGVLTFSKGLMTTIGTKFIKLDAFSALIVVLAEAVTVHVYTIIGVPVSTSQAVIGAVVGVGCIKGIQSAKMRSIWNVALAWIATPIMAGLVAFGLYFVTHLRFIP